MDGKYSLALRKLALMGAVDDYVSLSSKELGDVLEMSQQSASKRIIDLLEMQLITRDLGTRKQKIKITQKGLDEMRKEYNDYRRIFESIDQLDIRGEVASGMGEGGYYICQSGYMEQFKSKLGFMPYNGTFNVRIDPEEIEKLDMVRNTKGILIEGFTTEGRTFGNVIAYKAKIHNVDCAIVIPERSHYIDIIEIICQYHLRRTLGLEDGDRVDVKVNL